MKTCTVCAEEKPLEEFYLYRKLSNRSGRHAACRDCHADKAAASRKKNADLRKAEQEERKKTQCLYTVGRERCQRPGEDVISGPGFRFCEKHEPIALEVLNKSTTLPNGRTTLVRTCAGCGEIKTISAKNRCGKCYQKIRRKAHA